MNLGAAPALRSLRLLGNPLEILPELGANLALRELSLANVRIDADSDLTSWSVEVRSMSLLTLVVFPKGGMMGNISGFFAVESGDNIRALHSSKEAETSGDVWPAHVKHGPFTRGREVSGTADRLYGCSVCLSKARSENDSWQQPKLVQRQEACRITLLYHA